jgi:hypothetical protein
VQQPSSLIFLVIIAVWAVYFVQHWVRRREHLATARSVDQFSESLRVLERRTPLPATDLSAPVRPSYAVSPARAARPQVLVKRAETAQGASTVSSAPRPEGARPAPVRQAAVRPPRKVRGLVLLGSLAAVPVLAVCAVVGLVPVWSVLAPVVAVAASVAWLRMAVSAERVARAASRPPVSRPAARPQAAAPVQRRVVAPAATSAATAGEALPTESTDDGDVTVTRRPQELYDGAAVEVEAPAAGSGRAAVVADAAAPAPLMRPLVDEDDIPLTWNPVPVPPPTYTMKARVTRPAPMSADLVGDADTEFAAVAELREPVRRVAGA